MAYNPQHYDPQPQYHQQGGYQGSQQPMYGNQQGGVSQPVYGNQQPYGQQTSEQQQYGNQQAPMQQQYGQQGGASPKPFPRQRPPLPRSISSTNVDKTTHCRHVIRQDWVVQAPPGGTNFFSTVPAFTLTLPNLDGYPGDFQQCVFNQLIDKGTQRFLEEEKCLNWCGSATRLVPLYTTGDGNCLLHAASLGMWGFQDKEHTLRRAVHTALQNHSSNHLHRRWKHAREQEHRNMGVQLEDHQWEREWQSVASQASPEVLQGQPLESLEDFHIFVLANVLRRPIVMYAAPKLRSQATGGTLQHLNFHGIYLPLLWEASACKKDPLPLAYYGGHFVALVAIDYPQQRSQGSFTLPLIDFQGQRLPVRFALQMEDHTALVMDYLRLVSVTGHSSPYITGSNITCAALTIADRPAYVETLITGFIDACRAAHFGQQQQQQQQDTQPSQLHYNQLDDPPGSQANQPFYGNASAPKPSTGDQNRDKCINNCGMSGRPEWAGLCSQCYEKQHHIEQQELPQQSARNGQNVPFQQPTGFEPQNQPPAERREKCINNCGMFGDPSKGGLCSQCHQRHVQTERDNHHQGGSQVHRNIPPPGNQPSYGNVHQPNAPAGGQKCINDCGEYADPSNVIGMCQRCYQRETQAASANEGNRGGNSQNFQQPQQNFGGQAPSLNSGSIKCPRCSNPGHPNYLGMCEACYQRGNAGGRDPSPQRKNDHVYETIPGPPGPAQDPNARTQCRTPGCDFFGTAQTANYCSQCFERDMERILREADNPMAQQPNPPLVQPPRQPQPPPQQQAEFRQNVHSVEPQFPAPQLPPQAPPGEPAKCFNCKNYFANDEYGGMCSSCFMEKTKTESQEPVPKQPDYPPEQHFNQAPRYDPCQTRGCRNLAEVGGYCNECLREPEPRQRVSTAPVGYNPRYEKCSNMDCNNPRTQNGYCDNCNMQAGRSYAATQNQGQVFSQQNQPAGNRPGAPVPKPRKRLTAQGHGRDQIPDVHVAMGRMNISGGDDQCFLCNNERGRISTGNTLCRRHAEETRKVMTEQHGNPQLMPQSRSEPQFYSHTQPQPLANPSHGGYQNAPSHGQFSGPQQQPQIGGMPQQQQARPPPQAGGFGQGVGGHGQSATHRRSFGTDFSGSQQPGAGNNYPQQQARPPPQAGAFGASGHGQPGQSTARGNFGTDLSQGGYPARQDDHPPPLHPREPMAPRRTPPPQQKAPFGVNMEPSPQHRMNGAQGATRGGGYVGGEVLKQLCAIPGCSFKGYRELHNLCPDCYEERYNKRPPDHLPLV